jgi:hypothetical protein
MPEHNDTIQGQGPWISGTLACKRSVVIKPERKVDFSGSF